MISKFENQNQFEWAEDWIKDKLIIRLWLYKKKYPMFNIVRFVDELTKWPTDEKTQRWWPYMKDEDIKKMNVRRKKRASWSSLAKSQS
jgi:hypothetical protein